MPIMMLELMVGAEGVHHSLDQQERTQSIVETIEEDSKGMSCRHLRPSAFSCIVKGSKTQWKLDEVKLARA